MATTDRPGPFGALLRQYRATAGLSQEELAERASVSRRAIADLERGTRRVPYPATVRLLSEALRLADEDRVTLLRAARGDASKTNATGWSPPPSLPLKLTSFVGREHELNELVQLVEAARLVSLVGPGGVGKTRLALEVASVVANRFGDGAFLVDLAAHARPELVVLAVAGAVGLRVELDREPAEAVFRFLASRKLLMVLDNCEHVAQACAELVGPLLQRCPGVTILATSREPLGLEGEACCRLEPLDEAAAFQLFVDRARARRSELVPGDEDVVRQICQTVDHLPLAIELAAARIGLLMPAEILNRLEDRFALLARVGGRGGSPRQQTLRATIDWSYELLEPAEAQLFRRLAVFVGPFDLSAANAMAGPETLDVLGRLVDKSFVIARPAAQHTRYRLLDTLRHYAWDRLRASSEEDLARRRHVEHYLARAESLYVPTESIDGATRLLDGDLDNLRSALEFCRITNREAGLRLIGCTRSIWFRQDLAEGRRWAYTFLDLCPEPSLARCHALLTAGLLEGFGGADPRQTQRLLEQARDMASAFGDRAAHLYAEFALGSAAYLEGRAVDAVRQFALCQRISEELGDADMTARVLLFLGLVLLTDRERREEARAILERAQRLGADMGDRFTGGLIEYGFGLYWRWTGHAQRALVHFRRAAGAFREIGEVANLSLSLLHIARLTARGDALKGARLSGAALAIGERAGTRRGQRLNQAFDQVRAEIQTQLGADLAQQAWTDGERLSVDEAVSLALEDGRIQSRRDDALSPRELQVARLVAQSLTSVQIADALHLSPRTVDNHLAHIFDKLGLSSRLQLAAWLVASDVHAHTHLSNVQ